MHPSSMALMTGFVNKYLANKSPLKILDVGSMSVSGGAYDVLFNKPTWKYRGVDIAAGPNVHIVSPDPYNWPIENDSFDVVISGQCMEHVEAIWLWAKEIERVCKPGGLICIIAPWTFQIHRHPVDCWRILPDGMDYIMTKHCKFKKFECDPAPKGIDCCFIGQK